ncbi:hypothetical protein [Acinetobacter puyangensis]|uniref:hypothetical protein n=1 Tax=Acinetobacter puyangensis TaxID=1096779 RepID=UPI003A4D317E
MNTAVIFYLLLLFSGAVCLITGIYLLLGTGFALLAASLELTMAAAFLRKGLINENITSNPE